MAAEYAEPKTSSYAWISLLLDRTISLQYLTTLADMPFRSNFFL